MAEVELAYDRMVSRLIAIGPAEVVYGRLGLRANRAAAAT